MPDAAPGIMPGAAPCGQGTALCGVVGQLPVVGGAAPGGPPGRPPDMWGHWCPLGEVLEPLDPLEPVEPVELLLDDGEL